MYKKLTIEELKFLKNIYKVNWPIFVPTFGLMTHFIERFERHPEWQQKVQFITINEDTLKDGTYLMIYCNHTVYFNSLEPAPYKNVEKLLTTLDFSEEKQFRSVEIHHVEVIERIIKSQNLEKLLDESVKCNLTDQYEVKFTKPPEGFYYDSLSECDVLRMTEISHYETPSWYFENVVKYNITTGLYTNGGKLVAWIAVHEGGSTGMLNVDANYRRQKFGTGVKEKHDEKMFAAGKVICNNIFDKNETSVLFFKKTGHGKIVGNYRWIYLRTNNCAIKNQLKKYF